ncbi:MAG: class III signal peptide-containing protein [Nanoarchaeota archaeon]
MKKNGQTSTEFIILIAALLVVLVVMMNLFSGQDNLSFSYGQKLAATDIADSAAFVINEVALAGDNATGSFFLPSSIKDNLAYNLTINSSIVSVTYSGRQAQAALITSNVTSTKLTPGTKIIVRNNNGAINFG